MCVVSTMCTQYASNEASSILNTCVSVALSLPTILYFIPKIFIFMNIVQAIRGPHRAFIQHCPRMLSMPAAIPTEAKYLLEGRFSKVNFMNNASDNAYKNC